MCLAINCADLPGMLAPLCVQDCFPDLDQQLFSTLTASGTAKELARRPCDIARAVSDLKGTRMTAWIPII